MSHFGRPSRARITIVGRVTVQSLRVGRQEPGCRHAEASRQAKPVDLRVRRVRFRGEVGVEDVPAHHDCRRRVVVRANGDAMHRRGGPTRHQLARDHLCRSERPQKPPHRWLRRVRSCQRGLHRLALLFGPAHLPRSRPSTSVRAQHAARLGAPRLDPGLPAGSAPRLTAKTRRVVLSVMFATLTPGLVLGAQAYPTCLPNLAEPDWLARRGSLSRQRAQCSRYRAETHPATGCRSPARHVSKSPGDRPRCWRTTRLRLAATRPASSRRVTR